MNLEYKNLLNDYVSYIEKYMEEHCFIHDSEPQQTLFSSMRYSLLAGGKRLRPVLVFDFCRMCGADWKKAVPFAAAVEMVHTYSLIHDDLPCMDDDDLRRGNPTNHKVYGEAIAVLAGDALLTAAFNLIAKADYPADVRIKAVEVLSECSGELGMVGGQVLDIQSEERVCTSQEVIDIQSRKTGALIRAACILGVLAGNGSKEQIAAAVKFATHVGLAFQIRDDILDQIGDSAELGKKTGGDANKNTFVNLYGLHTCKEMVHDHTKIAISSLHSFKENDFIKSLALNMVERTK